MRVEIEYPKTAAVHIDPKLVIYRKTTLAFLRKYFRMSMELGHLPSLLGREFFRTHVTTYSTFTFEDAVIFTHDVERCLEKLPPKLQQVIARVFLQEYTADEAAGLMGYSERTVRRWRGEALDRLAEVFVTYGLIEPMKIAQAVRQAEELGLFKDVDPAQYRDVLDDVDIVFPPKKKPVRAASKCGSALHPETVKCG